MGPHPAPAPGKSGSRTILTEWLQNQGRSLERAQVARNWLLQEDIARDRMRTISRDENETIASNETDSGRAENRRIEFYIVK